MPTPIDPARLADARLQLHWASQVLSGACDALFERKADDSQSSLWHVPGDHPDDFDDFQDVDDAFVTDLLPSSHGLMIRFAAPEIGVFDTAGGIVSTLPLHGRTLSQMIEWVEGSVPDFADLTAGALTLRDYEMPPHPLADGAPFSASDAEAFRAAARWFTTAHDILSHAVRTHGPDRATDLLLWPHHFDLGAILLLEAGADPSSDPCVGIGFSLGDATIPQPYYYANPYAVEKPAAPPPIPAGRWADQWFGAILTDAAIRAQHIDPESATARAMVRDMIGGVLDIAGGA